MCVWWCVKSVDGNRLFNSIKASLIICTSIASSSSLQRYVLVSNGNEFPLIPWPFVYECENALCEPRHVYSIIITSIVFVSAGLSVWAKTAAATTAAAKLLNGASIYLLLLSKVYHNFRSEHSIRINSISTTTAAWMFIFRSPCEIPTASHVTKRACSTQQMIMNISQRSMVDAATSTCYASYSWKSTTLTQIRPRYI